jgi:hypothetical protein
MVGYGGDFYFSRGSPVSPNIREKPVFVGTGENGLRRRDGASCKGKIISR